MKRTIFLLGICLCFLLFVTPECTFAEGADSSIVKDMMSEIEKWLPLPNGSIEGELIPMFIRLILGIFSVLLTAVAIYAGILFVGQFGNEERVTKARNYLIWSLVGIAFTALAYTIIAGILALDFG